MEPTPHDQPFVARHRSWLRRALAAAVAVGLLAVAIGANTSVPAGAEAAPSFEILASAGANRPAVRLGKSTATTTTTTPSPPTVPGTLLFPIDPLPTCYVHNNFGEPRSEGRTHEGDDIQADLGRPVYAVVDGVLNRKVIDGANAALSGNAWYLTDPTDKTYYFYAHLSGFAEGLEVGSTVTRGQLIGYVGNTGNPGANNFHLHFEIHPKGSTTAVDPQPLLAIPASCGGPK